MINSCKCNKTSFDPAPLTKCSNCGCAHYKTTRACQQPNNSGHTWVDRDTLPKRRDIPSANRNTGNGSNHFESSIDNLRRTSRQQSPQSHRRSSERRPMTSSTSASLQPPKKTPITPIPPTPRKSDAPRTLDATKKSDATLDPSKEVKRASFLLPGDTEPTNVNGDKIQNGTSVQSTLFVAQQPQPIHLPSISQSEQLISKSCSLNVGNNEFTEKFTCFLKKVKSTEIFIRNLFKDDCKTNKTPPSPSSCAPPIDKRPSCGICVNNCPNGMVGDPCSSSQNKLQPSDSGAGNVANQSLDLAELKNTVQCLKDMMCKQKQNDCPKNDSTFQRVLEELKKHIQPDAIDKLLKTPPPNDAVALIADSTAPFVFVKCRPFCDQHGVFIVEWKVSSFLGIGGYEIYVDGVMKQNIRSAIRNTALIPGVNPKCEHLVTIIAVPLPNCNLNSNDQWAPANCRYRPGCSM